VAGLMSARTSAVASVMAFSNAGSVSCCSLSESLAVRRTCIAVTICVRSWPCCSRVRPMSERPSGHKTSASRINRSMSAIAVLKRFMELFTWSLSGDRPVPD